MNGYRGCKRHVQLLLADTITRIRSHTVFHFYLISKIALYPVS